MPVKQFAAKVQQGYEYVAKEVLWYYFVDVSYKGNFYRACRAFPKRQKKTTPIFAELEAFAIKDAKRRIKRKILRRPNT